MIIPNIFIKRHGLIFLCLAILLLTTACHLTEPSKIGEVAPVHSVKWIVEAPPILPKYNNGDLILPNATKELSIIELLDIALQNNPLTKQSWQNARAAAFTVRVNEAALYPTLTLTETIGLTKTAGVVGSSTTNVNGSSTTSVTGTNTTNATGSSVAATAAPVATYAQTVNSDLTASWLMLDFGGREASIDAARYALYASNWAHNRIIQNVMINVLRGYYSYINALSTLEANESDLKDSATNLDAAKNLFQAGIGTIVDVLQAQSNYVNAELQVVNAKGQVNTTLGQLANALGLPANTPIKAANLPPEATKQVIQEGIEQLMEIAKESRPDLQAAYANFQKSKEEITVFASSGLPIITANLNFQKTNFIHNSTINGYLSNGNIMLSMPLFSGFLYWNEVLSARANANAVYDSYKNTESGVYLDVLTSFYAYKTAIETLKYSEEYLKFSQEAYDAALGSYRQGIGSFLDVLVAQTQLSNARAQRVQAITQFVTSVANVAYATGML